MQMSKADKEMGILVQKIKSIEKILMGNGTVGLMKKMEDACNDIIGMKKDDGIKMWIYKAVVGTLIALTTWLTTELYHIKFGGG